MMNIKILGYMIIMSTYAHIELGKPLGTMVDIGDHRLHMYAMGTGIPVIFDASLGNNVLEWTLVQPEVAKFAQSISYDRSGLGWSEKSILPRTSKNIVEELRFLLQTAQVQPPYILVGHSSGGITMRLFANFYPDEVFGVVLVDSSYENQRLEWERLEKLMRPPANTITTSVNPLAWLPEEFHIIYQQLFANPEARATGGCEHKELDESFNQVKHSTNNLDNKPLMVITRGTKVVDNASEERRPFEEEWHQSWLGFQKNLVALSPQGKQIIADGSGHMTQRERPDLIINAIHEMVQHYQNTLTLYDPPK